MQGKCASPPRSTSPAFEEILQARLTRRDLLKATGLGAALFTVSALSPFRLQAQTAPGLTFKEVPKAYLDTHQVAPGYEVQLLLRWGDPLFPDAPPFDPLNQTAAAQSKQFGYNNDFIAYFPYPRNGTGNRALLCVNHEFTNPRLMFAGIKRDDDFTQLSEEQMRVEMEAQGVSIVEMLNHDGRWSPVIGSPLNRRITATTSMKISGPAAGHARMKTAADPEGKKVKGTFGNCAGGTTPWGTYLTCEENFDNYFLPPQKENAREKMAQERYGIGKERCYDWHRADTRFDTDKEPHEPNRFGWVVEMDPYDASSTPVKRTALGRFKRESATCVLSHNSQLVVYSGDDERFEYVYRYVSKGKFDSTSKKSQGELLDEGTLYAAKFHADGRLKWLPLVYGAAPLNKENGFESQADILIETRRAADLMGATPMDRPEDVDVNPVTGNIYIALTNNDQREKTDEANSRAKNRHGHIIELIPAKSGDHTALEYRWDIFLLAGDPSKAEDGAVYGKGVSKDGWLSCPDNLAFDTKGRMWIATDGMPKSGFADGLFATETEGAGRAVPRQFFTTPKGAEMAGPCFSPDGTTLFLAVQHPADDKGSNFDNPSTRWPDFKSTMPPRPSLLAIVKKDGGEIGS